MILTSSESSGLESSLGCWEIGEYIATGIVILGCLGEFLSEFTNFWNVRNDRHGKDTLGKLSALVLIGGLAVELVCLVNTNNLSGRIIAGLVNQAAQANKRSLELEAEIQPRYLSDEQQSAIGENLRRFAGRELLIASQWIDAEAARLARQVKTALNSPFGVFGSVPIVIMVGVKPLPEVK
jgi:hypothetical protein